MPGFYNPSTSNKPNILTTGKGNSGLKLPIHPEKWDPHNERLLAALDEEIRRRQIEEKKLAEGKSLQGDWKNISVPQRTLREFVRDAWHVVEPGVPFRPGWHIDAISDHLEACTKREIRNLLINMPPRHSKSSLVSVMWFCWSWTFDPTSRWIFASHTANLSTRDSLKCRRIIDSPWFQKEYGALFRLNDDQNRQSRFENNWTGYRIATSVAGGVLGEGADMLVCMPYDTPILTDRGYQHIGAVVEGRQDCKVASWNHQKDCFEWVGIDRHECNPSRPMVKMKWVNSLGKECCLRCTEDHPFWVFGRNDGRDPGIVNGILGSYIAAKNIKPGDRLCEAGFAGHGSFSLRGVREGRGKEKVFPSEILQSRLFRSGSRSEKGQGELHCLWEGGGSEQGSSGSLQEGGVLFPRMPREVANGSKQSCMDGRRPGETVLSLWQRVFGTCFGDEETQVLQPEMLPPGNLRQPSAQQGMGNGVVSALRQVRPVSSGGGKGEDVLQCGLQRPVSLSSNERKEESSLRSRGVFDTICAIFQSKTKGEDSGARWSEMPAVWKNTACRGEGVGNSPYRLQQESDSGRESDISLRTVSREDAWQNRATPKMDFVVVSSVEHTNVDSARVYNVATRNKNYFVADVEKRSVLLSHNCDDPQKAIESTSPVLTAKTAEFFFETLGSRGNSPHTDVRVVVMQRLSQMDLSAEILKRELGYDHLCLPARFEDTDEARNRVTSIGFVDPRADPLWRAEKVDQLRQDQAERIRQKRKEEPDYEEPFIEDSAALLLWPDHFTEEALSALEARLGPYGSAGQLQQRPSPRGGGIIKREQIRTLKHSPGVGWRIRAWDLAATAESPDGNKRAGRGDYTVGVLMLRHELRPGHFIYIIEDVIRIKADPGLRDQTIYETAIKKDGPGVPIVFEKEGGSAGVSQVYNFVQMLPGFTVWGDKRPGDKVVKASQFIAQAHANNIWMVEGPWNEEFLAEIENFPVGRNDDQLDGSALCLNKLIEGYGLPVGIPGGGAFRPITEEAMAESLLKGQAMNPAGLGTGFPNYGQLGQPAPATGAPIGEALRTLTGVLTTDPSNHDPRYDRLKEASLPVSDPSQHRVVVPSGVQPGVGLGAGFGVDDGVPQAGTAEALDLQRFLGSVSSGRPIDFMNEPISGMSVEESRVYAPLVQPVLPASDVTVCIRDTGVSLAVVSELIDCNQSNAMIRSRFPVLLTADIENVRILKRDGKL